jgi:hypothetical protein
MLGAGAKGMAEMSVRKLAAMALYGRCNGICFRSAHTRRAASSQHVPSRSLVSRPRLAPDGNSGAPMQHQEWADH